MEETGEIVQMGFLFLKGFEVYSKGGPELELWGRGVYIGIGVGKAEGAREREVIY